MNKHLDVLMHKEMTRQEFLATLGFGVAALFGLSSVVKLMTGKSHGGNRLGSVSRGYGNSAYGGGAD